MTIDDSLALGPLNLPVRYLLFAASLAVGYGVMSFALRGRENLRRTAGGRFANAVVLFVVVWKLEPLASALLRGLFGGSVRWSEIWLNLLIPGGRVATIAGASAVLLYLASVFFFDWRSGAAANSARPLLHAAGAGPGAFLTALLPAALVYLVASALLTPQPPSLRADAVGGTAVVGGAGDVGRAGVVGGAGDVGRAGVVGRAPAVPVGIEVGDRAPVFEAATLAGNHLSLAASAGRTIVLNFWATWCPPCRAELPQLVTFAAHRAGSSVAVWAVDMTSSEISVQAVRRFARENKIDFPVLLDRTGGIAAAYGVRAVPTTFVISARGIILAKHFGAMSPGWLRDHVAAPR